MKICDRRLGVREPETEAICAALLDILAAGARASRETNGGVPYSAAGGLVACDEPPSRYQFPVRKVPGRRVFGFPLGLWPAPKRIPGATARAEEVGEVGTPPW